MPSLDGLSIKLTAALEGPLLVYLSMSGSSVPPARDVDGLLGDSWQALVERVTAPPLTPEARVGRDAVHADSLPGDR